MGQSTDAELFYGYCWNDDGDFSRDQETESDRPDIPDYYSKTSLVGVGTHCSCECPMPFVCIISTRVYASRGYAIEIDPASLEVDPGWGTLLEEFCKEWDIDIEGLTPAWHLASMWC